MQIVVAERDGRRVPHGADAPQNLQRCWAAIDQVSHEPDPVAVGGKAQRLQQCIEFGVAALHVADGIERH
jgi:hypothetical protein